MANTVENESLSEFKFTSTAKHSIVYPRLVSYLSITLNHRTDNEEVGSLLAIVVDCGARDNYLFEITEADHELSHLFKTFFDITGDIQLKHLKDEHWKGLGIWGDELNRGNIVLVRHISILSNVYIPPAFFAAELTIYL
jgi:hypothetical protein